MSWVAVAVGGSALIGAGASAATAPKGPKTYDNAEQTLDNIKALSLFGDQGLMLNRMYNPAFAGIGNITAYNSLFGTPQSTQTRTIWNGKDFVNRKVTNPGAPGLMDIYQKAGNRMAQFNRQQIMKDLNFAPQAMQAYMGASPLLGSLQERAQQGLDQGGALDASTRRMLQQSALGDASMRGFGHSPLDAFMAYSSMGAEGEARKRQREQFALQTQGMMPDPFAIVGRQSMGASYGPAIGMQGAQFGRQASMPVLNPFAFGQTQMYPANSATSDTLGAISGGLLNLAGGLAGQRAAPSQPNRGPQMYQQSPWL